MLQNLIVTVYTNEMYHFYGSILYLGDLRRICLKWMWVRIKHAKNTRVFMWGQSSLKKFKITRPYQKCNDHTPISKV